ncbi:MAG: efflux RND transporter periplasmic adaptor subunit [Deinococcaceae bacterium]
MTRSSAKGKRWMLWVVGLVLCASAVGAVVYFRSPSQEQSQTSNANTAVATRGDFRVSVSGPGTLQAIRSLDIRTDVAGTLSRVPTVGQRFKKGDLIAVLDSATLKRNLESALLNLEKAQAQWDSQRVSQANSRTTQSQNIQTAQTTLVSAQRDLSSAQDTYISQKRVFAVGGISSQQLEDAHSVMEKAQAAVKSAQLQVDTLRQTLTFKNASDTQDLKNLKLAISSAQIQVDTAQSDLQNVQIVAPFNGVVSSVNVQQGAIVSGGATLGTLIDDSVLELPVQVDETEIAKVKLDQNVDVTLDAVSGTFRGKVIRISPNARTEQNIAIFDVTVKLDNKQRSLRPGMTAEAEIIISELKNVVKVPKQAIKAVRNRSYVEVMNHGASERVLIRTGETEGSTAVVTDGLSGGEILLLPTREKTASAGTTNTRNNFSPVPMGLPR